MRRYKQQDVVTIDQRLIERLRGIKLVNNLILSASFGVAVNYQCAAADPTGYHKDR